jgi:hypothetical protein
MYGLLPDIQATGLALLMAVAYALAHDRAGHPCLLAARIFLR